MSISLCTNSFVSYNEYRVFRGESHTDSVDVSGSYAMYLNMAIDFIHQYTDREFNIGTTLLRSEVFSGRGYNQIYNFADQRYTAEYFPIVDNEQVKLEYRSDSTLDEDNDAAWTEVDSSKYAIDFADGHLHMVGDNYFGLGNRNYRFTYRYGYVDWTQQLPWELKYAQMALAKFFENQAENIGIASVDIGNNERHVYRSNIPRMITRILDRYKRANRDRRPQK